MSIRNIAIAVGVVLVAAIAYLCLWPVPIEPVSWQAQTPPGYTGEHAPNTRLAGLQTIDTGAEFGPEHIAIGPDGKLYAAMESGNLIRMSPDGTGQEALHLERSAPAFRLPTVPAVSTGLKRRTREAQSRRTISQYFQTHDACRVDVKPPALPAQ